VGKPKWARALREARKRKGLSMAKAAKLVGCSQPAWANWERGLFFPSPIFRRAIKRKLGLDLDELRPRRKRRKNG